MKLEAAVAPTWLKVLLAAQAPAARWTWYCVAPDEPVHDSETELDVVLVTASAPGAAGTVPPVPQPENTVAHREVSETPFGPVKTRCPQAVS